MTRVRSGLGGDRENCDGCLIGSSDDHGVKMAGADEEQRARDDHLQP
jgi:hypothetical protein